MKEVVKASWAFENASKIETTSALGNGKKICVVKYSKEQLENFNNSTKGRGHKREKGKEGKQKEFLVNMRAVIEVKENDMVTLAQSSEAYTIAMGNHKSYMMHQLAQMA